MILSCKNITKSFGEVCVLDQVSFHVNEKEKVAVIGINGAGKSTLLKIIISELSADSGEIVLKKGISVGYLAQHQNLDSHKSIYEELLQTKSEILQMEEEIRSLELAMKQETSDALERVMDRYHEVTHRFELQNGYAYRSEVTGILKGLGFSQEEFDKEISVLSGGQKTRVALGKLLLKAPDLILLDEPTNHLDMNSITWLESYLTNYKGALIIVAHDRYFLDKIVTKVVEIDHAKSCCFEGNYSAYAKKSADRRETLMKHYLHQQREIKHQEEVIAKLRSFNREKSIKRAESREKLLEHMERVDKPENNNSSMNFHLEPRIMSGNDVLSVKGLAKAFGSQTLFRGISFDIKRSEKVAIIGNNGTGKTTILKIINGLLAADAGEIKTGAKVHIAYYDQEHHVLSDDKTVFDEISDAYPHMEQTAIRNTLAAFLFTGDDVFKLIRDLSGGEKGRVSLAKLMLSDANLIILDEPTNHLDIVSKEILEQALSAYTGTLLYVSHDRYFINKTATRILELTAETLIDYPGNYDFYLEKKELMEELYLSGKNSAGNTNAGTGSTFSQSSDKKAGNTSQNDWLQQKEQSAKFRKLQNELKKTEDEISACETLAAEIDAALISPDNFSDHTKLLALSKQKKENEDTLNTLMERWEALSEELNPPL